MARATYTSQAESDLQQIAEYIARENLIAALAWIDRTRAICDLLATQPAIGQRLRTTRFGDVRRHVIGSYLIYYQPAADGIDVIRIVHGAREQERLV